MSGEGGQDPGETTDAPPEHPAKAVSSGSDVRDASGPGPGHEPDPGDLTDEELEDPDGTEGRLRPEVSGFHRATAVLDQGEFLGELAELSKLPETHVKVEADAIPPQGCRLIVVSGRDLGMEWAFKVPQITIGRDEDCELAMSDIGVSRRHAKLTLEGERYVLTDLGSGNGTFLNGVRIESETLYPGDEVTLGDRTLRFVELSEPPRTGAAHPIAPARSPASGAETPEGRPDARGTPAFSGSPESPGSAGEHEGRGGSGASAEAGAAEFALAPGRALREVWRVLGAAAAGVVVVLVSVFIYQRYLAGETPAERDARARREFLLGVELVKLERCGDAQFFFRRVLEVRPGYGRATEYIAHCDREIAQWKLLERSRDFARAGEHRKAIDLLTGISESSAYADDAQRLTREFTEALGLRLVGEAQKTWDAGDVSGARELVARALTRAPGLAAAHRLRARMDGAQGLSMPPPPPPPPPPRPVAVPAGLERAHELYAQGDVAAALEAARAARGSQASEYVDRLKRVRKLLQETSAAHRAHAARDLLRLAPAALEVDHALLAGHGSLRKELLRYHADGFYFAGLEALQKNDDVGAFRLLSKALEIDPEHRLAAERLGDLTRRVKDIYEGAFAMKDTNPTETGKVFRRIMKMTVPSNPYHQLAAEWLRRNGR